MARNVVIGAILCVAFFTIPACAITPQITKTPRSGIEQQLLVRALERALEALNTENLKGKTVAVEFYGLSPDANFAGEFFTAWLQSQQVRIVPDPNQAELRLKVFAPVLAVDEGQSFIGAPSFTVPILGLGVPEISLFKNVRHSGRAEIQVYAIDADSGKFVEKSPRTVGETQYDDYTILLVVNFSRSDMDEPEAQPQPGIG
jgi:hypothetical protein